MKEKLKNLYSKCLKLVPVVASVMLVIGTNSAQTWFKGQEEIPQTAKKYRKF